MRLRSAWHMARAMRAAACLLALAGSLSAPLRADIRLIVSFDADGPRLVKAVTASAPLTKLVGQRARVKQPGEASAPVRISWFDDVGHLIDTHRVADPRIAHFPGGRDESSRSRVGGRVALPSGALLLRGPDAAQRVDIELPFSAVPLLAAARWSFELNAIEGRLEP